MQGMIVSYDVTAENTLQSIRIWMELVKKVSIYSCC